METTNDLAIQKQTITSREIAEITGKQHKHVMRDIRAMEPAWEKIGQSKFGLIDYTDQRNRKKPQYELTKTECLYVSTKFNDEARAMLVLRWEKLEKERLLNTPNFANPAEAARAWGKRERMNQLGNVKEKSDKRWMK